MSTRHLNHISLVDVIFSAKVEDLKMSKLAYLEDVCKKLSSRRLSVDVYQMSYVRLKWNSRRRLERLVLKTSTFRLKWNTWRRPVMYV